MAVIFIEGFDYYNGMQSLIGLQSRWTQVGTLGVALAAGRFGGQGFQVRSAAGASSRQVAATIPTTGPNFSCGFAYKYNLTQTIGGPGFVYVAWRLSGTIHLYFYTSTAGEVLMYGPGGLIGSSAAGVIVLNSWHYIEVSCLIDNAGTLVVKVDGATVINVTGVDTLNGATAQINQMAIGYTDTDDRCGGFLVDDIYMTNSTTSLGERRVECLRPSADTATKTWTPDTGTVNFSRVNETLVDGDTSYVETVTVGNRDLYSLGSLSSAPAAIDAVQLVGFGRKTDAATRAYALTAKSNGVDDLGTDNFLSSSFARSSRIMPTNPDGGGAWTAAAVNALQVGPKVTI